MPISLTQLDSQYPPTWTGTPFPGVPGHVDATTALRYIEGQDPVNYFPHQRADGDLFNRDLANYKNLKDLADYIGSRNGLLFNSPAVALAGNSEIYLSIPGLSNFPEYYLVAAGCVIRVGTASANTGVKVVNDSTAAVIATVNTLTKTTFFATAITDRGSNVAAALRVILFNAGSTEVVLAGWAALLPKTYS